MDKKDFKKVAFALYAALFRLKVDRGREILLQMGEELGKEYINFPASLWEKYINKLVS